LAQAPSRSTRSARELDAVAERSASDEDVPTLSQHAVRAEGASRQRTRPAGSLDEFLELCGDLLGTAVGRRVTRTFRAPVGDGPSLLERDASDRQGLPSYFRYGTDPETTPALLAEPAPSAHAASTTDDSTHRFGSDSRSSQSEALKRRPVCSGRSRLVASPVRRRSGRLDDATARRSSTQSPRARGTRAALNSCVVGRGVPELAPLSSMYRIGARRRVIRVHTRVSEGARMTGGSRR